MTGAEAQTQVAQGIQQLIDDPTQWQQWADTQAQFHQYSPGNTLLIMSQRPDASLVAGYKTWQKLDRQVQKGQHGITILAPVTRKVEDDKPTLSSSPPAQKDETKTRTIVAFRPINVFDISQTDGKPLDLPKAHDIFGDNMKELLDHLTLHAAPVPVKYEELEPGTYGVWKPREGTITLSPKSDPNMQLASLMHEWSHSVGIPDPEAARNRHQGQEEVTAETTAYITSKMMGLDTKGFSQAYVAGWAEMTPEKVKATMSEVTHRVKTITDTIEASPDPMLQRLAATWSPTAQQQQQPLQEVSR